MKIAVLIYAILAFGALDTVAQTSSPKVLFSDDFAVSAARPAGSVLAKSQKGDETWKVSGDPQGKLVFKPGGGVAPQNEGHFTALIPIPNYPANASIRIEADIDPKDCKFAALAFMPTEDVGAFWTGNRLLAMIQPNGSIALYGDAMSKQLFIATNEKYSFTPGQAVHLVLEYDPNLMTATLIANGTPVAADKALSPEEMPVKFACIRLEGATGEFPLIKNFSISAVPQGAGVSTPKANDQANKPTPLPTRAPKR